MVDNPLAGKSTTEMLQSEHAIIATDLQGKITFWNLAAERLYGWRAEEVLAKNILEVTPSRLSREEAAAIMANLVRGETWYGDFEVQRRDGRTFRVYVIDAPIFNAAGELDGIVGVSVEAKHAHRLKPKARAEP